jgi:hypothetical protein
MGGAVFSARSTLYAVTDQRVMIVTGKSKKLVTSFLLSTLSQVQMQQWSDGLGTITLGPRPVWPSNSGLYASAPSLENIIDSTEVFQLIAKGCAAGRPVR